MSKATTGHMDVPPRILITGMTSLCLDAMMADNLGNMVILEPMFRSLRVQFPESRIQTTLQLTPAFAGKYRLDVLQDKVFWEYRLPGGVKTICSVLLALAWRILAAAGVKIDQFCRLNSRFKANYENDIIVEFHGDMFGDFALNRWHFLAGILNPVVAKLLKKRIYLVASSPGPFSTRLRATLATWTLRLFDLVSVREPMSLKILEQLGLSSERIQCHPCFSFGFQPEPELTDEQIYAKEPRLVPGNRPLVGLIVCSLSLDKGPSNLWPRDDSDFTPYLNLIRHLATTKEADICLLSHRNKFKIDGSPAPGSDHCLVNKILELTEAGLKDRVFALNGVYDAATSNLIIGKFDVLVSGRIHGAVQGLIQGVPTLILDYGMEPRAHKLQGFAQLCGLSDYLGDLAHESALQEKMDALWSRRAEIATDLKSRVPALISGSQSLWGSIERDFQPQKGRG